MLILSLDTTTRAGSCALWRDGLLIEERVGDAGRTHAERLPADLADLLAAHGLAVRDVDLYAVASGPGSFTGLRVGIATVQGLALVHDRLVVPVSALEGLAQCGAGALRDADGGEAAPQGTTTGERIANGGRDGAGQDPGRLLIGAWMEAYRGEVFGALYRLDEIAELAPPAVADPAALAGAWRDAFGAEAMSAIIGDAVPSTRAILGATFPEARLLDPVPLAGMIARLAAAHPDRAVRPHAIVPLYVRRPDAELARDRAQPHEIAQGAPPPSP